MVYTTYKNCDLGDGLLFYHINYHTYQRAKGGKSKHLVSMNYWVCHPGSVTGS